MSSLKNLILALLYFSGLLMMLVMLFMCLGTFVDFSKFLSFPLETFFALPLSIAGFNILFLIIIMFLNFKSDLRLILFLIAVSIMVTGFILTIFKEKKTQFKLHVRESFKFIELSGGEIADLGFSLKLNNVWIETYDKDNLKKEENPPSIKQYFADFELTLPDGVSVNKIACINKPLIFKGWKFYLNSVHENFKTEKTNNSTGQIRKSKPFNYEDESYAVLMAKKDPGANFVVIGIYAMLFAMLLNVIVNLREANADK